MGRIAIIVILVGVVVCALESAFWRAATPPPSVAAVTSASTSKTVLNNPSARTGEVDAEQNLLNEPSQLGFGFPNGEGDSVKRTPSPGDELHRLQVAALLEHTPTEATITKEEENGEVVAQATDPDECARRMQDIVQNHPDTASKDLLEMFQSETDDCNKSGLLSAASQLPYDQNRWLLLLAALSSTQSADIREQAAAFAADDPERFQQYFGDSNPLVSLELESVFILTEPVTTIVGASAPRHTTPLPPSNPNVN